MDIGLLKNLYILLYTEWIMVVGGMPSNLFQQFYVFLIGTLNPYN